MQILPVHIFKITYNAIHILNTALISCNSPVILCLQGK